MLEITLDVLQLKILFNFDVYRSYDELHCWKNTINIIIETTNRTDTKFD